MHEHRPKALDLGETRRRILGALQEGEDSPLGEALAPAAASLVRRAPDWVASLGILADRDGFWVLVTRDEATGISSASPAAESATTAGGQFVMDIEPGRYFVETLDVATGRWISRESAPGHPLVAGLLCPGPAVVIRIRRVSGGC